MGKVEEVPTCRVKVCIPLKGIEGSNPSVSAENIVKRSQKPANHWFAGFFDFTTYPNCSFNIQNPVSNS